MAPEISIRGAQQSHKVDVYSLGVTMHDIGGAGEDIHVAIEAGPARENVQRLVPLLIKDPVACPSAHEVFLSIWYHDWEDMKISPCGGEQAPATVRDLKGGSKRDKHTVQPGTTPGPANVIKTRQTAAAILRMANAPQQEQNPTTTSGLFSQLPNKPSRMWFI